MRLRDLALVGFGAAAAAAGMVVWRERRREERAPALGGWPKVAIVGAGFAGLRAARALAGAPVQVILIDRNNYHLFQPLLYQVATAGLEPEGIAQPVRRILADQPNFDFRLETITGVDLEGRRLLTEDGPLSYDYLMLAAGATTNFFGLTAVAERAFGLKDLDEAVELRNRILEVFERAIQESDLEKRAALLTFVVVGGGPTGVEFAGSLAELIRLVLSRDYPDLDLSTVRVVLLEATPTLLAALPSELQRHAAEKLRDKGVEIRVGTAVKDFDGERVLLGGEQEIRTKTLVWTAGVRANDLAATLGMPTARAGRVVVEPTLQVPGHPEAYVVGDMAYLEQDGKPLPMVAPVAIQQGEHAAMNIARQVDGDAPMQFRYDDRGTMVTIGRNAAVAQLGPVELTGFPAWVIWLVVHLLQLIGFRNRLIVLINWAWDYLFYDRPNRLITRE